jgi:hypothetical protein
MKSGGKFIEEIDKVKGEWRNSDRHERERERTSKNGRV